MQATLGVQTKAHTHDNTNKARRRARGLVAGVRQGSMHVTRKTCRSWDGGLVHSPSAVG